MSSHTVQYISECFIKPQSLPQEWNQPFHLNPWDLALLSVHYIQKGLLFAKPSQQQDFAMETLLERLKASLSLTLYHFYPLAGRLKTVQGDAPNSCVVYVDCRDSPGARFTYATLDMAVSDILGPTDVPRLVHSFFDHHKAVNHDGHTESLLSVQVTELTDGVFVGCSMNHSLGDGTSYWNFFNSWSEIFRAGSPSVSISRPPILNRWIPDGHGTVFSLPFSRPEEFIARFEAPELRVRFFHFSAESIAKLKAKANAETRNVANEISSLQSLSALVWRCVTRARNLQPDRVTSCMLAASNRARMEPPIPENYFGSAIHILKASATAGELLSSSLGSAAEMVHEAVSGHGHGVVVEYLAAWLGSPFPYQLGRLFEPCSVLMSSSPRFNKYGSEFGMGKALALCSGYANKYDGNMSCYPGRDGGGSIDLEACLAPDTMCAVESDAEFMEAAGLWQF